MLDSVLNCNFDSVKKADGHCQRGSQLTLNLDLFRRSYIQKLMVLLRRHPVDPQ